MTTQQWIALGIFVLSYRLIISDAFSKRGGFREANEVKSGAHNINKDIEK